MNCPPLIRALAVETFYRWLEENRYLNMVYAEAAQGGLRLAACSQRECSA